MKRTVSPNPIIKPTVNKVLKPSVGFADPLAAFGPAKLEGNLFRTCVDPFNSSAKINLVAAGAVSSKASSALK